MQLRTTNAVFILRDDHDRLHELEVDYEFDRLSNSLFWDAPQEKHLPTALRAKLNDQMMLAEYHDLDNPFPNRTTLYHRDVILDAFVRPLDEAGEQMKAMVIDLDERRRKRQRAKEGTGAV